MPAVCSSGPVPHVTQHDEPLGANKTTLVSSPDLIRHVYHFQYKYTESDPLVLGLGPRLRLAVHFGLEG